MPVRHDQVVMGGPVVIIAWRDRGDVYRRANFAHVNNWLADLGWPVTVCNDGQAGPFNRSAAYNRGVAAHPDADVYVFHEADILTPLDALRAAATMAKHAPGLVVPFTTYRYLSPQKTRLVRDGQTDPFEAAVLRSMRNGSAVGAINVVSRDTMTAVGCWDETFQGWGFDDRAMVAAFTVATGNPTRYVPGPAAHLWHTPGWPAGGRFAGGADNVPQREVEATAANERRYQLYTRARTPQQIRALTGAS